MGQKPVDANHGAKVNDFFWKRNDFFQKKCLTLCALTAPMRNLLYTLLLLNLLLLAVSCDRTPRHLAPMGWTPATAEFDSLTLRLEHYYIDRIPLDSIVCLTERMRLIADRDTAFKLLNSRTTYWEGRLTFSLGNYDEGMAQMRKALELTDSGRYPYDYRRILWNLDMEYHEPTEARYRQLLEDLDFFRNAGDLIISGGLAMELGTFLDDLGAPDEGIPYLDLADSLFTVAGRMDQVANNRINHANAMIIQGDSLGAEKYFRELLADTVMPLSHYAREIAYGNIYTLSDDTVALRQAYEMVRDETTMEEAACNYESFLTREAINRGDLPQAIFYQRLAASHFPFVETPEVLREYYQQRYRLFAMQGMTDSAYKYLEITARLNDSINTSANRVEVRNAALAGRIRLMRLKADLERRNSTILFLSITFGLLLLIIGAGIIFWRHLQRQELAKVKATLDLERSNRKILAMELVIKEKDTLFDAVGQEMSQLSEAGEISPQTAGKIESSLKAHNGMKAHRDNFLETFGQLNPNFAGRLKEHYPSLTDADLRLASYIALGLENKHIASIMGIRPESVKQARWRLRSKLSLPSGASLEETLRSFAS